MIFDGHISLGAIIEMVTLVVGLIGMAVTFRERLNTLWTRADTQDKQRGDDEKNRDVQHEENQKRLKDIELQLANNYVKKDDFQRFEDRLGLQIKNIEHTVNNASMKTVGMVKDLLFPLLTKGGRE